MTLYLALILGSGIIWGAALWLACKNGSKAAQLAALKEELKKRAKEQERAQKISENIYHLTVDDARRRLHDVANKQCNGMQ